MTRSHRNRTPLSVAQVFVPLVCFALMLAACHPGVRATGVSRIVPQAPGGSPAAAPAASLADRRFDASAPRPWISVDPADTILQVVDAKLGADSHNGQIIAVKRAGDVESPVRILVADADSASGSYYYQSWESPLNASDSQVFSLAVEDLVGDHGSEIVASGMDGEGRNTLDVFRAIPGEVGKRISFKPICQLVANLISIEQTDRPESYTNEGKPGASFDIVEYLRDPDSQNAMDLVQIRHTWKAAQGRYVPGPPEKKPGAQVLESQLKALFSSTDEGPFEQFLTGSWVHVSPAPNGKGPDKYGSIIDFDPRARTIAISSGNTLDVYLWKDSRRQIYNRLLVIGENATVPQIQLRRTFSVNVDAVNSISVTIGGSESGETLTENFTKVTDDLRARLDARPKAQVQMTPLSLQGTYTGADGLAIDFHGSQLLWTHKTGQREETFVIFSLGTSVILSARANGADGQTPGAAASWRVDFQEKKDAQRIVRTLTLTPIQLTVGGFEDTSGEVVALTQTEAKKK
jgi:hypothetical protein